MIVIRFLRWNNWNVVHIARHAVSPEEVEQVCANDTLMEQGYKGRVRLTGATQQGRILAIVLAPEAEGVYYPITARPASRPERRRYEAYKGGEYAA